MSKKQQLEKNLTLSKKLAEYIASNPSALKNIPSGVSFVAFSSKDQELNKLNSELVKSLKREGKKIVKATEKKDKNQPWAFSSTV